MEYGLIIITGASSGLGAAYAAALAGRTGQMVLVARRAQRLEELAADLKAKHPGLQVACCPCDLADPTARRELIGRLESISPGRTLLVNDAGLGDYGEFATAEEEKVRRLLEVNIVALAELTRAVVARMVADGGDIINVASLAADVFLPDFALYAASKSFVTSFSEALRLEMREYGVRVLAVCPGPVHTEFGQVAQRRGYDRGDAPLKRWFYTPVETVVQGSLRALATGKARFYPSFKVYAIGCLLRALPLWALRGILGLRPRRVHVDGRKEGNP